MITKDQSVDDDNDAPTDARQPIRLTCAWCGEPFVPERNRQRKCAPCQRAQGRTYAAPDGYSAKPNNTRDRAKRKCLSCGEMFTSSHKGNRMCHKCKSRDNNAGVFGW